MDMPSTGDERDSSDLLLQESRLRAMPWGFLYTFPWWGLALVLLGIWVAFSIAADEVYSNIFRQLVPGITMTLRVAVTAYLSAFFVGLMVGMIRSTQPKPRYGLVGRIFGIMHLIVYNVVTFFVMVMRGLPILLVLLFFAFVIVPAIKSYVEVKLGIELNIRGSSPESAIIALAFTYGAFLSETFRAGIQSIEKGQIEAARSLGMNYVQAMRYVVLPQAIRRVLPPLGNDFISMIKDSSLVSALGINDLTKIAQISAGASFRYLETLTTAALIYLTMTIAGSLVVRYIERRITIR